MRFWPFRRRPVATFDSPGFAIAELAPQLGGVLTVEQVRAEGHAVGFGGRLLLPPSSALTELVSRFRPFGYTPFLQAGGARGSRGGPPRFLGRAVSRQHPRQHTPVRPF